MTTVAIVPISGAAGEKAYRAVARGKQSVGKTAGLALDALFAQLGEAELNGSLVIQSFNPDSLFDAAQQERLSELMSLWRSARDQRRELPEALKEELDKLVETELSAATVRAETLLQQEQL